MCYRRAVAAVLAVPAMPIQEYQMRPRLAVHRLVHPIELLHRRARHTDNVVDVVYIDHDHLIRCAGPEAGGY